MKPVHKKYPGKPAVKQNRQPDQVKLAHDLAVAAHWTQSAIDQRANCVGIVLEGILHDAEACSEWKYDD